MNEITSLALLIADLNIQVREIQAENAALREELQVARERERQRKESEVPREG